MSAHKIFTFSNDCEKTAFLCLLCTYVISNSEAQDMFHWRGGFNIVFIYTVLYFIAFQLAGL